MTSRRRFVSAPAWDEATIESDRRRAIADFIEERTKESSGPYRTAFLENVATVETLFTATRDLLELSSGLALAARPSLIRTARYLSEPPISADDLDALAEARIATRKRLDEGLARKAAEVVSAAIDGERFPWLFETPPRLPTTTEREMAIRWTAGLQTIQEVQTRRRTESSARQERAVEQILTTYGFTKVPPRAIDVTGGLLPGEFSRESLVAGTKCDIPIGLRDGRFLFIECKVSNSSTNSVKRPNRECGGKSRLWRAAFGDRAIAAAVLAGVFRLRNLIDAQANDRLLILWEHNSAPLTDFLRATE